jgi:menaquinone-9 beta-reductase
MPELQIAGGGPAGAAAALAALSEGASVHVFERSRTPRHKVCGEFIAPEACAVLQSLGVWPEFLSFTPPSIRRCVLSFGRRTKGWTLSEPAFGFSRIALDSLLLDRAAASGARVSRGRSFERCDGVPTQPAILAHGRSGGTPRGRRLFGFKAHFEGPTDDAVELFFTRFGYVGVSPVEGRQTNVCGLAPEDLLSRCGFDIDALLTGEPALSTRLRPLARIMPWIKTGPLVFSRAARAANGGRIYAAGDALGFVDPFTGSGILNALLTGRLAGTAAARETPPGAYERQCAALLDLPFATSAIFRMLLGAGLSHLAMLLPGDWLYRLTRAHLPGELNV